MIPIGLHLRILAAGDLQRQAAGRPAVDSDADGAQPEPENLSCSDAAEKIKTDIIDLHDRLKREA